MKKVTAEEAKEQLQTYSPFYMEFYQKGVTETVTLRIEGRSRAHQLRKRLHGFRRLLQLANHPMFTSAATIKLQLNKDEFEPDTYIITTAKRDQEFDDVFKDAGLKGHGGSPVDLSDEFENEMFSDGENNG